MFALDLMYYGSRDRAVCIVTRPWDGCPRNVTRIPAGASYISLVHDLQTKNGTHPATYVMGTRGKAAVV
jgi:hypothetical protein